MPQPNLSSTFIVLNPQQLATQVPVTPSIYQELDANFNDFAGCMLVAQYTFSSDWATWEMHPKGDETLYLVSGEAILYLYVDGVVQKITFNTAGSFVIIPKGVWHTAKVKTNCTILFITPGEGTVNGPDPRIHA